MWPISDRVRMQPCHPGSRPCVATRRFCCFKSSSYSLPCPYLVSHNSPVSTADLGWSYACAHHSLMVAFAYLFNLSVIHIFTQRIFTKPLSQVFMSSGWHDQESSFLSRLLQILPFRLCSDPLFHTFHLSQCSQQGVPLRECWGQRRAWHSLPSVSQGLCELSYCPTVLSGVWSLEDQVRELAPFISITV